MKMKMKMKKTLTSSKDDDENENENDKKLIIIKELNDDWDEIIDKSKSFEDQIKSTKKVENINEHYFMEGYGDKKLEFKIFKLRLAHLSNIIYEKLFKQIFGHTFESLESNQIIVNNIEKNKDKLYEEEETSYDYVIQPSDWCINYWCYQSYFRL